MCTFVRHLGSTETSPSIILAAETHRSIFWRVFGGTRKMSMFWYNPFLVFFSSLLLNRRFLKFGPGNSGLFSPSCSRVREKGRQVSLCTPNCLAGCANEINSRNEQCLRYIPFFFFLFSSSFFFSLLPYTVVLLDSGLELLAYSFVMLARG